MKRLALLMLPLLMFSAHRGSSQPLEVQSVCNLAIPDNVRVFNWSSWRAATTRDQNLFFEPFRWDASRDIWKGYESDEPFDQPSDAYRHWSVTLTQGDGTEQWIYILSSRKTPETHYIYVFDSVQPGRDSSGNHFGFHPCRAFAADSALINDWLSRVYNPN